MSGDWLAAGQAIAEQRVAQVAARGAAQLRDEFPGVEVTAEPDAIVLSGRGLFRRWIDDARLRAIGSILKGARKRQCRPPIWSRWWEWRG